jgi:ATP-binding cassette subfamily B protein RaxB
MRAAMPSRPAWRQVVPDIRQVETAECGLACLAMIAVYHGQHTDLATLRRQYPISLKGTTLAGLIDMAERMGLAGRPLRLEPASLARLHLPAVLHWT